MIRLFKHARNGFFTSMDGMSSLWGINEHGYGFEVRLIGGKPSLDKKDSRFGYPDLKEAEKFVKDGSWVEVTNEYFKIDSYVRSDHFIWGRNSLTQEWFVMNEYGEATEQKVSRDLVFDKLISGDAKIVQPVFKKKEKEYEYPFMAINKSNNLMYIWLSKNNGVHIGENFINNPTPPHLYDPDLVIDEPATKLLRETLKKRR